MDSSLQNIGDLAMTQSTAPRLGGKMPRTGDVDKAAKDFESMFMSQMLQPMFEGMSNDPIFGGGHGEQVMRTFLVQEYGKIAAQGGHLGIAAEVKNEMIKAQAATSQGGQNVVPQ